MPDSGVLEQETIVMPLEVRGQGKAVNPAPDAMETDARQSALAELVDAANVEKARQMLHAEKDRKEDPFDESIHNNKLETPELETESVNKEITTIEYALIELEKKAKSGDLKATRELGILLGEQGKLRKQLKEMQNPTQPQGVNMVVALFMERVVGRIVKSMTAPINQPLETLRQLELKTWRETQKASGKSDFLCIPSTVKAMIGMKNTPTELAENIEKYRKTKVITSHTSRS